jgi:carboxyl-terminal processing protease
MKKLNWILGLALVLLWGCQEEPPAPVDPSLQVKKAIFNTMREWYFWNLEMPKSVNFADFETNEKLLDGIIHKPLDRFSYLTTQQAFNNSFVGINAGHGFGFGFTSDDRLYITYVFDEAPAGKDGWKRGWEIIQINGQPIPSYKTSSGSYDFKLGASSPGITNTFTFKLPDGTTTTRTNVKAEYQSNSVLERKVFEESGKKIGYWAYQSFKATAGLSPTRSQEVQNTMEFFQTQGINELIIDLRYNGGGSVAVAEQILNYLIQSTNSGKLMYTNKLNPTKLSLNTSKNFSKIGTIALSKVIFITSRGSASASELIINSLTPYMDVILIGDNTYGKPVGSFPLSSYNSTLSSNNVELVPITFAIANSEGRAEYFDGFPANFKVGDSPQFPWGDKRDSRLAAAIQYLTNGTVGGRMMDTYYKPKWEMIDAFKGLLQEFPAF